MSENQRRLSKHEEQKVRLIQLSCEMFLKCMVFMFLRYYVMTLSVGRSMQWSILLLKQFIGRKASNSGGYR